jgi:hypothetical protein
VARQIHAWPPAPPPGADFEKDEPSEALKRAASLLAEGEHLLEMK